MLIYSLHNNYTCLVHVSRNMCIPVLDYHLVVGQCLIKAMLAWTNSLWPLANAYKSWQASSFVKIISLFWSTYKVGKLTKSTNLQYYMEVYTSHDKSTNKTLLSSITQFVSEHRFCKFYNRRSRNVSKCSVCLKLCELCQISYMPQALLVVVRNKDARIIPVLVYLCRWSQWRSSYLVFIR